MHKLVENVIVYDKNFTFYDKFPHFYDENLTFYDKNHRKEASYKQPSPITLSKDSTDATVFRNKTFQQ